MPNDLNIVEANDMPVRGKISPQGIAFHWTGTPNLEQAVNTNKSGQQFGYQYLIDKDGTIRQNVPEGAATWHVLPSKDKKWSNANMLGVSFIGSDKEKPTPEQLESGKKLANYLSGKYNIPQENYLGHGQLNPGHRHPEEGMELINYIKGNNMSSDDFILNPEKYNPMQAPTQQAQPSNENYGADDFIMNPQGFGGITPTNQPFYKSNTDFAHNPFNLIGSVNVGGAGGPLGFALQQKALPKEATKFIAKDIAAKFDNTIGGLLPFGIKNASYAFGRMIGDDEKTATAISDKLTSYFDKPIGKAFGISDDPAYKGEALGKVFEFIGDNIHKGSKAVADTPVAKAIGLKAEDVDFFANMVLPKVAELGVKGTRLGAEKVGGAIEQAKREFNQPEAPQVNFAPTAEDLYNWNNKQALVNEAPKPQDIRQMVADFESKKNVPLENIPVENKPSVEFFNPETQQPVAQPTALRPIEIPQEVPVNRAEVQPFKPEEVQSRSDLLNRVGIENQRESALNANPKEASSQYITSKAEQGPYGQGMTEQINYEKGALTNHFNSVEKELGGVVPRTGTSFEVTDRIEAGKSVKGAIEKAQKEHQTKTTELYKKADELHGDKPVDISNLNEYLKADENFVYAPEQALQKGLKSYLSRQNLLNEAGDIRPMTAKQSEGVRKFINKNYNYETKKISSDMKNIIDKDVFESIGGEINKEAREHFRKGKEIYDNPKAIRDLLSDEGVNQKIADEKVINKIVTLDESQFAHMVDVLNETGQKNAMNQVRTSLVNRIKEAGQSSVNEPWNSVAAAKEYSKIGNKLNVAFADNPEILAKIADGVEAGNIVHIPNKYPGAAVQSHLMQNKFADIGLRKGGQIIGGAFGGTFGGPLGAGVGAMGGEAVGSKASQAVAKGRQARQLKKEIRFKEQQEGSNKLKDFTLKD